MLFREKNGKVQIYRLNQGVNIMKKLSMQDVDKQTQKVVEKAIGSVSLAYNHNGANVFIHFERTGAGTMGYESKARVCVVKSGKTFIVGANEEIGNEYGTVFTRAMVDGLPHNEDVFYPYLILTADEKTKKPDTDIMNHIETILSKYEKKDAKNPKLAKIFRSYVPGSYDEIREQFESDMKQKKAKAESDKEMEMVKELKDNLRGF